MALKRIGILGGMGPAATLLLMQKVIDAVAADDDSAHVPLLVDQNTQVPSRIAYLLEGSDVSPGPVLAAMARGLASAGACALAMPCNTAHHFAADIRAATDVPFLDMTRLAARHAASHPCNGRVGILGSPALRPAGVFDDPLAEQGLAPVFPTDEAALLDAIRSIKRGGPGAAARQALWQASDDLVRQGATVQLVACTEFSLIAGAVSDGASAVDTLDPLTTAIVAAAHGAGAP